MNYTVADWRLGTDPNLIKLMRNFPQALRQTGFQRLFSVPVFLNPTISYFPSFEERSQARRTTKSKCNIECICKKRGEKISFHTFWYSPISPDQRCVFPCWGCFYFVVE